MSSNKALWIIWLVMALALAGYFGQQLFGQDQKADFLIGQTSHGHFQIELQCDACHTEGFSGTQGLQEACLSCHAEELKISQDSHPKAKFTDPRNVDRLKQIDARWCVSCHVEHHPEVTREMGVSQPDDFCFHCHQDIAEDRPSHQGMEFATCASSGCHNYHDNRALYEDFLVRHAQAPWLSHSPIVRDTETLAYVQSLTDLPDTTNLIGSVADSEAWTPQDLAAHQLWQGSAHAAANIGCANCHGSGAEFQPAPSEEVCATCHLAESTSFQQGKHGMRIKAGLSPMTPQQSIDAHGRLAFNTTALEQTLSCSSCHSPHSVDRNQAAVEGCLSCHGDDHSQAFLDSPHGELWQGFMQDDLPREQAVSCATCHMATEPTESHSQSFLLVNHNQNANLRPNEKMLRPVCMNCHGLAFSIDALADKQLILNNFKGTPQKHVRSIDMSLERLK